MTTKAGAISVAYPSGVTAGQLPVLSNARVSMIPLNDKTSFGVDWTLTCGGNAQIGYITTGCGSLLPSHTASGAPASYTAPGTIPVDTTVTITARVTSDPSQQSSVTITIVNPPISVALSATPASLLVGGTANVSAVTTSDINSLGVNWTASCGSSDCGSFSPPQTLSGVTTTYTAPKSVPMMGGTVTVTATSAGDKTKSASATISILPITVLVSPLSFYVATSGTEALTAQVANDAKNAGVTWSCGFSGCGTFTPASTPSGVATTFTAPSAVPAGGKVTITATSANDASTSAAAVATVTASPIINVTLTRTVPRSLAEGKTAKLGANVTGDTTNAGVDWTASCGSGTPGVCGTFNPATTNGGVTTYTAPSSLPPVNPVVITATSHAYNLNPALFANAATASTTITAPVSVVFTQQPPASVTTNGRVPVSANVINDATPGGITWAVQCSNTAAGACGYVQPQMTADNAAATYVAPPVAPGVPVQLVATATAFPTSSVQTNAITIVPSTAHSISFVPFAPSQLLQGTTVSLDAAVANDSSQSGVDWSVCASGCGFFTIKPAIPAIPAVPPSPGNPGSPYVPSVPAVTATSAQGWPNGLPIPYTAPTVAPNDGSILLTAAATVDRLNNANSPATAVATIAVTSEPTGPELHGIVQAGTQPVVGASVYLYAASTNGYASASTPIYNPSKVPFATSDSSGNFTFPAGFTCPALTSQVYLVALGGHVGTAGPNPNLGLMTALGSCGQLSVTPVVINEATAVASATALATFSADNVQTGELSYLYIGSSSANATVGLANAFASVHNLVDITTGLPKFFTVAGNGTVPYVQINTLADALNACVVTAGGSSGDGTVCGNLFFDTNPLGMQFTSTAPTDTLQAVFDLVKPPSPGVPSHLAAASVYGMASLSSPYQPILSSAPSQQSISLSYAAGGGFGGSGSTASGSSGLAIDASGNVWIANKNTNSVSEWNSFGASYSPNAFGAAAGGFTGGGIYAPNAIAIDPSGYVWSVNGNSTLSKLDSTGKADTSSPFSGGGLFAGAGIAIDGPGSIWVTNSGSPGSVSKFDASGIPQSPSTGYTGGIADPSVIAIDGSNNIWVYNQQTPANITNYVELNDTNGALTVGAAGGNAAYSGSPAQLAISNSGNVWSEGNSPSTILEIPAYTGLKPPSSTAYGGDPSIPFGSTQGMAFDGSNRLWVASAGQSVGNSNIAPNLSLFDTTESAPNVSIEFTDPDFSNGPSSAAVDNSGNIWVLLGNNTVKEYVGVATPVVTPLSLGVKLKKLGAKP